MNKIDYNPQLTRYLVEKLAFDSTPFFLVDVGASGGIGEQWKAFKEYFKAIGFEPLIAECERLNREKAGEIEYLPYFITSGDKEIDAKATVSGTQIWHQRSSSKYALEKLKINWQQEQFNLGKPLNYSEKSISLDDFFSKNPTNINFIKIDTDGSDYQVLYGAGEILNNSEVLGVIIEADFHAKNDRNSSCFRNIDRLLSEKGFSLFDLSTYRYSKRDLPNDFLYAIPAQTKTGQVAWGDALYLRDFAAQSDMNISAIMILKLACIMEIYGLYDCAVELLKAHRDKLTSMNVDIDICLDLLTKGMGMFSTYEEHISAFKTDIKHFYPKLEESKTFLIDLLKKMPRLKRLIKKLQL